VTDAKTGDGIPSVSVVLKGTKTGVITNVNGEFSIGMADAKKGILVFSLIGYSAQEISVGNQSIINIQLEEDTKLLNEVEIVAIGYGEGVSRRDLISSVSSVGAKQLKDIPITNAAEALTGRLAGVRVTTTEGAPGADIQIRVRGGGSITQDNSPIYIVDGIQLENALNFISPQDIETIDVLKDASSTAIYGARGANGVVIITTKKGKVGKTTISYNGSTGYREITQKLDVMNPYNYARWQYERSRGDVAAEKSYADQYGTWETINNYKTVSPVDWQQEVFGRKARYQNHNLILNGGSANTNYNLSLTANKEEGVLLESGFDRYLATFRLDHKVSERLKMGLNVRYSDQIVSGGGTTASGTKATNRLRHAVQYRPLLLSTDQDIEFFDEALYVSGGGQALINPIAITEAEYRKAYTKAINLSGYFTYNVAKNLTFKSTFGIDNNDAKTNLFFSKITSTARNFATLPVASIFQQNTQTFNNANTLQYAKKFVSVNLPLQIYNLQYEL
jgi:TonB-linked SusC/RagA family outer membrane protein